MYVRDGEKGAAMLWRRVLLPQWIHGSIVILFSMFWAGCSSTQMPPRRMTSPTASATVTHHAGAPLAQPTTRSIDPAAADALSVQVSWMALERVPDGLTGVTPTARLIAVP